jgi:hypothetical protein
VRPGFRKGLKRLEKRLTGAAHWLERLEQAAPTILLRHWPSAAIGGLILCTALLWQVPKWEVASLRPNSPEPQVIEAEDKARSTLAQILGGAFIFVGLGFTWWRIEISRQGQVTERFTQAVEQLGSRELSVRVGAVYALERIAGESEKDRWSIISLLAAFVRDRCGVVTSVEADPVGCSRISSDSQTALSVLGRLLKDEDFDQKGWTIDLRSTDLRGVMLDDANLPGVMFTGSRLDGASLARANLRKAVFLDASLEMTNLSEANLDLADFEQVRAPHADLSCTSMAGAVLKNANFGGADLSGADLEGVVLIETHLEGADLRDTVGVPFMFPLPFARVYVDRRTQVSSNISQWLILKAPAS